MIGEAVHGPPQYKNYVLCTLIGLMLSTFVIGAVAVVRLCLDRHSTSRRERALMEVAQKFADNMPQVGHAGANGHHHHHHQTAAAYSDETCEPMLGSSGFQSGVTTAESSRVTTATHSRNASDGSSIPVAVVASADDAERLRLIQDSKGSSAAPV